jgi:zinc protease
MTIEARPTGALDAQFDELFWKGTPYAWPIVGRVGDVESISRRQLVGFFSLFYQPSNLVGIVVGDFDPAALKPILAQTFGRLQAGRTPPPPFEPGAIEQVGEQRFSGQSDGPTRLELRYHTVPFRHPDSFALEVMAELLNAPDGRLRDLLIGSSPSADGVRVGQMSRRLGGCFYFIAEPAESATATELERKWTAELDRLRYEPITDEEMERVRQRITAGANLEGQSNRELAFQFGVYEAMGGWEYTLRRAERLRAVTAEDVMRIAKTYFDPANRAIAVYTTRPGGGAADNPLAAYPPEVRAQYEETLSRLMSYEDPEDLRRAVAAFEEALERAPEPHRPAVAYILQRLRQRLEELEDDRNP